MIFPHVNSSNLQLNFGDERVWFDNIAEHRNETVKISGIEAWNRVKDLEEIFRTAFK